MPRLFTGIALPADVAGDLLRLKAPLPGARWIEPENLHITLRFAGDIDNTTASEFVDALAQISLPAFDVSIAGLGVFGGEDPRALYAEVKPSDALEALARANERAARRAGLPPETRAFKPHVTIARLRYAKSDALARFLTRHGRFQLATFHADRFQLFSSKPRVGGGPYVVEEEYPLQQGSSGYDWSGIRKTV